MTTIIAQFRVFAIMVALSLVVSACGEPVATDQVGMNALDRGNRAIIPDYGRIDRGMSRQDAMVTPPRDVGVSDQGTTNPEVYIPYGQCPDGVDFVGQVLGSNSASPNGGTPQFLPFERVYNAGIETIYARLPERTGGDDPRPVTVDIDIERATVVATRPKVNVDNSVDTSRGRFWIQLMRWAPSRSLNQIDPLRAMTSPTWFGSLGYSKVKHRRAAAHFFVGRSQDARI
jgi:hypothetical protein